MFKVQEYLQRCKYQCALTNLKLNYDIKIVENNYDNRIILNYKIIGSPRSDITNECRALTLDKTNFNLIARSFGRFFNLGEYLQHTKKFRWDMPIKTWDKIDGSLIQVYFYNGWKIQTRGSFADGPVNKDEIITWEELIRPMLDFKKFAMDIVYTFEFCSKYNQVVQLYEEPKLYLLSAFQGYHELDSQIVDALGKEVGVERPKQYNFRDTIDVQAHIADKVRNDMTYEGVVLMDCNGMRLKVKSPKYLALSRFNDPNSNRLKNIVTLLLDGELDEVLVYFPHIEKEAIKIQRKIERAMQEVDNLWYVFGEDKLLDQKQFAISVKDHPLSSLLFLAKKKGGNPKDYINEDHLIKNLKFK